MTSGNAAKIVLITGASRGIGAATARLAAANGYDVAVNYVRDQTAAAAVVADIEQAGRRAVAIQADTGQEGDVARLFAAVDAKLGRLTHLVYNTGITGPVSRVEHLAGDVAREILAVNVFGAFLCARAAVPRLSRTQGGAGGAMVFISSAMATLGGAGEFVMYATSKGAVESLSIGLARELAGEGIRSNVVASPVRLRPESTRQGDLSASSRTFRWAAPAPWTRSRRPWFSCCRSSRPSPPERCYGWPGGDSQNGTKEPGPRATRRLRPRRDYL
jgi:NAD(P)-dependent dehydrogenase (short-subunit alcohol dehydrogenase family)